MSVGKLFLIKALFQYNTQCKYNIVNNIYNINFSCTQHHCYKCTYIHVISKGELVESIMTADYILFSQEIKIRARKG